MSAFYLAQFQPAHGLFVNQIIHFGQTFRLFSLMGSDDDGQLHQPGGWLLAFHPELVRNTPLAQFIKNYSFFSYSANEALHLSEQERRTIIDCMCKIREELLHPIDKHTKSLIT